MAPITEASVTTEVLWRGAAILAAIDAALLPLVARRIVPARLPGLKWAFAAAAAVYWLAVWALMSWVFWDAVYRYVFPGWARWLVPPAYGALFGAVALGTWYLAPRLPGHAIVNLCLLGGVWGGLTHVVAVLRGIADKPPLLHGASPVAAVVIAIPEFTLYWCAILGVAALAERVVRRRPPAALSPGS
jgi:hypothetical protein